VETNIRLIDTPFCPDSSSVRPRSVPKQWQEALHPAVNRTAVNGKPSLSKPFGDVGIA
jgi:hypothetical protein